MLISPWYLRKYIYNITYTTEIHLFVLCFFLTWFPQLYKMKIAIGTIYLLPYHFLYLYFCCVWNFLSRIMGCRVEKQAPKKCFYYKPPFNRFEHIFYGNLHDSVSRFVFIQPNWRLKRMVLIFYYSFNQAIRIHHQYGIVFILIWAT